MNLIVNKSSETEAPYAELSFYGGGDSLWAPDRTGNYADDCDRGRAYARELITYMRLRDAPMMLGYVSRAIGAGEWSGVEVGFFQELAERAVANSAVSPPRLAVVA